MRYLTIPPNIVTKDLPQVSGDELSFHNFFLHMVAPKLPFTTPAQVDMIQALALKLAGATEPGSVVELKNEEHAALHAGLPPVGGPVLVRMLAFYSAVAGAAEKEPVTKAPPAAN